MTALDMLTPENQAAGLPRLPYVPTGFRDVASAVFGEVGMRVPFSSVNAPLYAEDFESFHDRDRLIKERFGVKDPLDLVDTKEIDARYSNPTAEGRIRALNEKQSLLDQHILAQRKSDERWKDIRTKAEIEEFTLSARRSARQEAERVSQRASGFDRVAGSLVGGIGGAFTDPINLATLPLGAASGMGVLRAMGTEALVNAAIEAAETPIIVKWQRELGYKYGVGEAVLNIATAGAGGAAFTALVRGAGKGLQFAGSKGMRILDAISRNEKMPSAVRDAAQYMSRVAHIDEEAPVKRPSRSDTISHRQAFNETQEAFRGYRAPVYERAAAENRPPVRRSPKVGADTSNPSSLKSTLGYTPESLTQFIKRTGGIQDHAGELKARDITNKRLPGLIMKKKAKEATAQGVREIDNTLDYVKQRAFDEGYFPDKNDYNEISDSELLDAIADDLGSKKRYKKDDLEAIEEIDQQLKYEEGEILRAELRQEIIDKVGNIADLEDAVTEFAARGGQLDDFLDEFLERQAIIHEGSQHGQDMAVRPDRAFETMQRDVEIADADTLGQSFEVDFAALVRDNPDMRIMIDGEERSLKEVAEELKDNEKILNAIKTCALKS